MKTTFILALAASFVLSTTASACCVHCDWDDDDDDDCKICGKSYNNTTETRDLAPFSRVRLSHAVNVNIVQGDEQTVVVMADDSIIDKVNTEVSDGVLRVYIDEDWFRRVFNKKTYKVTVDIVVPELTAIDASGATNVSVIGFRNENFTVKATGASDIRMSDIIVNGITSCEASGASKVKIAGKGEKVIIRASGASNVVSKDFATNVADVHASGASDVKVTAYDEITVDCSGASDVDYYGHPKAVDVNTSGASDVKSH